MIGDHFSRILVGYQLFLRFSPWSAWFVIYKLFSLSSVDSIFLKEKILSTKFNLIEVYIFLLLPLVKYFLKCRLIIIIYEKKNDNKNIGLTYKFNVGPEFYTVVLYIYVSQCVHRHAFMATRLNLINGVKWIVCEAQKSLIPLFLIRISIANKKDCLIPLIFMTILWLLFGEKGFWSSSSCSITLFSYCFYEHVVLNNNQLWGHYFFSQF